MYREKRKCISFCRMRRFPSHARRIFFVCVLVSPIPEMRFATLSDIARALIAQFLSLRSPVEIGIIDASIKRLLGNPRNDFAFIKIESPVNDLHLNTVSWWRFPNLFIESAYRPIPYSVFRRVSIFGDDARAALRRNILRRQVPTTARPAPRHWSARLSTVVLLRVPLLLC